MPTALNSASFGAEITYDTSTGGSSGLYFPMYPQFAITAISIAANAVVTANNILSIGDSVYFSGVGGMVEINGLTGQVVSATPTSFVININSTTFTTYTTGGSAAQLGGLVQPTPIAIFDNQSNVSVGIANTLYSSVIAGSATYVTWKTFAPGQGLVLDLRTNKGAPANELVFVKSTLFLATSTAGTGTFRISIVYAS